VGHGTDVSLIFDIVIAHNGDEPLKDKLSEFHFQKIIKFLIGHFGILVKTY